MVNKKINFKIMSRDAFISHLEQKAIKYSKFMTTTILGLSVVKICPENTRMMDRLFDNKTGVQMDSKTQLSNIELKPKASAKLLIKIIDSKINNMSTKGVYHPRRLQPKWQSLKASEEKLELFRRYMKAPTSSIGFLRLIKVNLPSKTLESVVIDHPEFESLIGVDGLRQKCIDKFKSYENGRAYLKSKQLL